MVSIFVGSGAGFARGSGATLGGAGILGSGVQGRSGETVSVNAATGNLLISQQDEFLVGRGPDAAISRTYNSLAEMSDGDNGDQWQFSSTRRVFGLAGTLNTAGSTIRRQGGDGSVVIYSWDVGQSAYITNDGDGAHDRLIKSGATWVWTDGASRVTETYEASVGDGSLFRLKALNDTDGNALGYLYVSGTDKLEYVTTANHGRVDGVGHVEMSYVQYVWSGNNIDQIVTGYMDYGDVGTDTDNAMRSLERTHYAYDVQNRLTQVLVDLSPDDSSMADGRYYSTTYAYDGNSKRVASITQADGSSLGIAYDGSGRVTTLTQTVGVGDTRVTSLFYAVSYTSVTGPDGQVTRLDYDGGQRLTKVTVPPAYTGAAAQAMQFAWDSQGHLTSTTDAVGKVTSYTYDANGNLLTSTDPNGSLVTRSYGPSNRLLTETRTGSDASGAAVTHTTRYVYDGENHLRFLVTSEGRVTEYQYTAAGEVYLETLYPEHSYPIGSGALSITDLATWRAAITDERGIELTYYGYDARGSLTNKIAYGAVDLGGNGLTTDGYSHQVFGYDQSGKLLTRITASQNAETFVYDGLGRLVGSTDMAGGTTTIVFNDAALTTTITTASGYTTVNSYNKAGDLVAEAHSGSYDVSGSASYQYDKNGRLRIVTDATGNKTYYLYDKAGRKIADIDHYGDVTEYRYDPAGRLAATFRFTYDLTNGSTPAQIAALEDPNSVIEISTIRPAGHPYDVLNWMIYDDGGRLIERIEGDGGVSVFSYDASDRLVKTVRYFNRLDTTPLRTALPTSLFLPVADARDTVARSFFDRDGRLIGSLDGEGYLTETVYDKAGQKIEDIAYATKASSSLWASGTFDELRASAMPASSANRRSRYAYDGQGLLRFEIDPAGRVTEYVYQSEVAWGAIGLVRSTISHAVAIATNDFNYDNVKALVAANASNIANRTGWSVYDNAGRRTYAIDSDGSVTSFTYDVMGNVIRTVAFAAKRLTASLPDEATMNGWRDINIGNTANRISRNWYSASGDLRFTVDPEAYVTRFDYDAEGRVTREVTRTNKVTVGDATSISEILVLYNAAGGWTDVRYGYDHVGRRNSVYDGEGNRTVFTWYGNGVFSSVFEGYGTDDQNRTVYLNNGSGRVAQEIRGYLDDDESLTQYFYDGIGNLKRSIDPLGRETTFTYDERGLLLTRTDAAGGVTSYEYNAFGEVVKTTDPNGGMTYSYYDELGRVAKTRDAEDYVTETTYTAFGEVATVTRRYNKTGSAVSTTAPPTITAHVQDATTSFEYDKRGLVIKTTDAEGWFETYGYDALGNRISVTAKSKDASKVAGGTTTYAYDRRGLLVSETLPIVSYLNDGSVQSSSVTNTYAYDARGNRIQMVEAVGLAEARTTAYVYDRASRLVETIGQTFLGVTPHSYIRYDARGNVTSTVDPAGARTVYYYDNLDRVIVTIDAVGAYTEHSYDANSNVTTTRVWSTIVTVPADGGSQEEAPAPPGGPSRATNFTYDNLNRLTTSSVTGAITGYWNGSTWVSSSDPITTTREYDANGNIVKTIDASGQATLYYFNSLGQKRAQIDAGGYITYWSYDSEGNVTAERRYATRFTGSPTTATIPAVTTDGADRFSQYGYDRNGNRTHEQRESVLVHNGSGDATTTTSIIFYQYNGLGQVVRKIDATGEFIDYGYDAGGRLLIESRSGYTDHAGNNVTPTVDYRYNGLGNLTRTVAAGGGDAAGRVTTYHYDGDKLRWVADAGGFQRLYWYDIAGRETYNYYQRVGSNGTASTEYDGLLTNYDAAGRVIQQWQANNVLGMGWVDSGPRTATTYNAYGEATSVAVGGITQQQNQYDGAGRLVATNSGDGVWKHFGYDAAGNQTIAITSAGASLASLTFTQALGLVGQENVNATYTMYDARGQAISATEEQQRLSAGTVQNLTSSRSYNAFGDVVSETNAAGATTTYSYNNIGRMIRSEGPTVEITLENGAKQWVKPSQDFYYDASGRLVATRDANGSYAAGGTSGNGTSKAANSGNLTRLTLLAGTGYNGSEALVTQQIAADGGVKQTKYDVHGDARTLIDEIGRTTTQLFDGMGRVTQVGHAGGLIDSYAYDGLGQRIKHWNNFHGSGEVETTDYDTQGRVTKTRAFGGDITTTSYTWDGSIAASGMGVATGGWKTITSTAADRVSLSDGIHAIEEKTDLFGRLVDRIDARGDNFDFGYDAAGRLISENSYWSLNGLALRRKTITYFNTGQIASITSGDTPVTTADWSRNLTTYGYDAIGNQTAERHVRQWGDYTARRTIWLAPGEPEYIPASYVTGTDILQDGVAEYDLMGRMTRYRDIASSGADNVDKSWAYDGQGNIRKIGTTYRAMQANGQLATTTSTLDHWYRYDSMNRTVVSKGALSGGVIVRGASGTDLSYNEVGERQTAQTGFGAQEVYGYNNAGLITSVVIGGVTRATTSFDIAGRVTGQIEYDASGTWVNSRHSIVYDARGLVLAEKSATREGSDWIYTHTANYYSANGVGATPGMLLSSSSSGTSTGSLLYYSETKYWKNGSSSPVYPVYPYGSANFSQADKDYADAYSSYEYDWSDGPRQVRQILTNRDGTSTSQSSYSLDGRLTGVTIGGGTRPRTIAYTTNAGGQILSRKELDNNGALNDPSSRSYFFAGKQMGEVSNNGTENISYATWIANRTNVDGTGPFREGATTGAVFADFDQNYAAMNGGAQASAPGTYVVQTGDTLQGIAAALWGDASLWYKLAEANGAAGSGALIAGTTLVIPTSITNIHNNADTFQPYDPAKAIGNISPNTPKPPKQNKKCGAFGMILVAAIAIGVALVTSGAFLAATGAVQGGIGAGIGAVLGTTGATVGAGSMIAAGAIGGAVGSIASQGFGVATGIQDKFSWKGVGLAAIAGGIGGAVGGNGLFGEKGLFGSGAFAAAGRGAASSAATQGIALATGLQSKFDFAGVAAAGVGAGIGNLVGGRLDGTLKSDFAENLLANTAGGIANAATRSAIRGNSFGDNLRAALPDIIGQTIGNAAARGAAALARSVAGSATATPTESSGQTTGDAYADEIVVTAQVNVSGLASSYSFLSPEARIAVANINGSISPERAAEASSHLRQIKRQLYQEKFGVAYVEAGSFGEAPGPKYTDGKVMDLNVRNPIDLGTLFAMKQSYMAAYESGNGVYSEQQHGDVMKAYADREALIRGWDVVADGEINKLMFVAVGAPALIAGGAALAPVAAGYAGSFFVGQTASTVAAGGAGFATGGTFGAAFEYGKNESFGLEHTAGGYTTAILGGGLGATGLKLLPTSILGRAVSARAQTITLGAFSGGVGDISGQLVTNGGDYLQVNYGQALLATGLGGSLGAVTPLELRINGFSAGRNNSLSIYQGLSTRMNSGNITQMQLRYPVNAGAANAVVGSGQQVVGTIVDGVKQRVGQR